MIFDEWWSYLVNYNRNYPTGVLVFTVIFLQGAMTRFILKKFKYLLPESIFNLMFGIIWGVIYNNVGSAYFKRQLDVEYGVFKIVTQVILAVSLFHMVYAIDFHILVRNIWQILIVGIPMNFLATCMIGYAAMCIVQEKWTFMEIIIFGACAATVYASEIVGMLKLGGFKTKNLIVLLEAETVIALAMSSLSVSSCDVTPGVPPTFLKYLEVIPIFTSGIIIGAIMGKIVCYLNSLYPNDAPYILTLTIVPIFFGIFVCRNLLKVSGVLYVIGFGVMLCKERTSLPNYVDCFVVYVWETFSIGLQFVVLGIAGFQLSTVVLATVGFTDFSNSILIYLVVNATRLTIFTIFYPILKRLGNGFTFNNMLLAAAGAIKCPIALCIVYNVQYSSLHVLKLANTMIFYHSALMFLSLIFNVLAVKFIIRNTRISATTMGKQMNMNSCLKHVLLKRDVAVGLLKMDRLLADINWPLVIKKTSMRHPYKRYMKEDEPEEFNYLDSRPVICPDCMRDVPREPTMKEYNEMLKEARMRVLKAKKFSYSRMYERGTIKRSTTLFLKQLVDEAMETELHLTKLDSLINSFSGEGITSRIRRGFFQLLFKPMEVTCQPPSLYWKRQCYNIVNNKNFDVSICCCIVCSVIPIIMEWTGPLERDDYFFRTIIGINFAIAVVYFLEFTLKLIAFSFAYFKSVCNVVDMIVVIASISHVVILNIRNDFNKSTREIILIVITVTKCLRIIRLLRLLRYFRTWYPKLMLYCDYKIDSRLASAYEMGNAFVHCQSEVMEVLDYVVDNADIRKQIHLKLESDRLKILKLMGQVQKSRPWIATTVTTKVTIMLILSRVRESINELKTSGWVDGIEYKKLMDSLEERILKVNGIKSVSLPNPKSLFNGVSWMGKEDSINEFLHHNVSVRIFNPGELVVRAGDKIEGIFLVVTGALRMQYSPTSRTLKDLHKYGILPTVESITSTHFEREREDYLLPGYCIGEMGILTDRHYNCSVLAELPTQLNFIPAYVVNEAIRRSSDPIHGLERRMWSAVAQGLCVALLMKVPAYQDLLLYKIRHTLQRSFLPKIGTYKNFVVHDHIEDIILVEGIVADYETREIYIAPCYIPRTVQTLVFPSLDKTDLTTEPKILIIPVKDANEYDVMIKVVENSQLGPDQLNTYKHMKKYKKRARGIVHVGERAVKRTNSITAPSLTPPSSTTEMSMLTLISTSSESKVSKKDISFGVSHEDKGGSDSKRK